MLELESKKNFGLHDTSCRLQKVDFAIVADLTISAKSRGFSTFG
ncbi:hypothetical protein HMPREF0758_4810 [Serratia odorifera DSM 4582]|uniref:Uncharacterized protein n=1 Tax=Serratia odorifera DSM 4582 TaxID=667129 RepID=D4E9G0_SEROD|nr:hypothetical protein HMPREF0758_4810 [Serratia odorifera DSM 4582]